MFVKKSKEFFLGSLKNLWKVPEFYILAMVGLIYFGVSPWLIVWIIVESVLLVFLLTCIALLKGKMD